MGYMGQFEIITSILNLIAVILIPVVSVCVGQHLQNREAKRKDKLEIFKTLMANRVIWSPESVRAMNTIDIVFSTDKGVRKAWKEYYDALCVVNPNEIQAKRVQQSQIKLLEEMAVSLGYKDKITWETIQNPYIPQGMVDSMGQQKEMQNGQVELAKAATVIAQVITANSIKSNSDETGGNTDSHP